VLEVGIQLRAPPRACVCTETFELFPTSNSCCSYRYTGIFGSPCIIRTGQGTLVFTRWNVCNDDLYVQMLTGKQVRTRIWETCSIQLRNSRIWRTVLIISHKIRSKKNRTMQWWMYTHARPFMRNSFETGMTSWDQIGILRPNSKFAK
jgi:hypothetical protein